MAKKKTFYTLADADYKFMTTPDWVADLEFYKAKSLTAALKLRKQASEDTELPVQDILILKVEEVE